MNHPFMFHLKIMITTFDILKEGNTLSKVWPLDGSKVYYYTRYSQTSFALLQHTVIVPNIN